MTSLRDSIEQLEEGLNAAANALNGIKNFVDKFESMMGEVSQPVAEPKIQRGSMSKAVLDVILKSEKEVSVDDIKAKTGLDGKKIFNILNKAKKDKKIKSAKRGFYVKVEPKKAT